MLKRGKAHSVVTSRTALWRRCCFEWVLSHCPVWQEGARGSGREVPGMDMRILDKQAPAAEPRLCSSEWTKARLWEGPECSKDKPSCGLGLELKAQTGDWDKAAMGSHWIKAERFVLGSLPSEECRRCGSKQAVWGKRFFRKISNTKPALLYTFYLLFYR